MTYHENKRNKLALLYSKQGCGSLNLRRKEDGGVSTLPKEGYDGRTRNPM